MKIESRLYTNDLFLVPDGFQHKDGYSWQKAEFTSEYGEGSLEFVFMAAGVGKTPYCFDLIHADTQEQAETLAKEMHRKELDYKMILKTSEKPVLLHRIEEFYEQEVA